MHIWHVYDGGKKKQWEKERHKEKKYKEKEKHKGLFLP